MLSVTDYSICNVVSLFWNNKGVLFPVRWETRPFHAISPWAAQRGRKYLYRKSDWIIFIVL